MELKKIGSKIDPPADEPSVGQGHRRMGETARVSERDQAGVDG
jgi:hypothetical protein